MENPYARIAEEGAARPPQKGWWSRNWPWFVPVGCLGFLLLAVASVALLLFLGLRVVKSSDVYVQALERARTSPAVAEALGSPIEDGMLPSVSIHLQGSSGKADLTIPLSGPRGKGTLYALGTRHLARWKFTRLEVAVIGSEDRINLLEEQ